MKKLLLEEKKEIRILVNVFYSKVRKDEFIGPVFNDMIHDWPSHLEKLTSFWHTNLNFVADYKGNPGKVHIKVDQFLNGGVVQEHFFRWMQLWFETIDELCEGEKAEKAKKRARKMSTNLYVKIFKSRG